MKETITVLELKRMEIGRTRDSSRIRFLVPRFTPIVPTGVKRFFVGISLLPLANVARFRPKYRGFFGISRLADGNPGLGVSSFAIVAVLWDLA